MAAELSAAGKDVVILEKGGYYSEPDFTGLEAEMTPALVSAPGYALYRRSRDGCASWIDAGRWYCRQLEHVVAYAEGST